MRIMSFALAAGITGLTASAALADNSACLSSGGDWKATGGVESAVSMTQFQSWSVDFAAPVVAERMVPPTPMNPAAKGDCMVKSAGGLGTLPDGCKKGGNATVTGRLSFDDKGLGIVNVAKAANITCQ